MSAGQDADVPVHFSSRSQAPFAARHTYVDGWYVFAGHPADEPVQYSVLSHPPATAGRHAVPAALKSSTGHTMLMPLQTSALSQDPADGRQTVPSSLGMRVQVPNSGSSRQQSVFRFSERTARGSSSPPATAATTTHRAIPRDMRPSSRSARGAPSRFVKPCGSARRRARRAGASRPSQRSRRLARHGDKVVARRTPIAHGWPQRARPRRAALRVLVSTGRTDLTCTAIVNGGAWCWGDGSDGQLGNGSVVLSRIALRVSGL